MNEDERRHCVLDHPGHPDRPSIAAPGSVICKGHQSKCLDVLNQLADFSRDADTAAHDMALSRHIGAPVSGSSEVALSFDARVAEHKVRITEKVTSWAIQIAEERDVHLPTGPSTAAMGSGAFIEWDGKKYQDVQYASPDLKALCAFLRRHHDWAVGQDWADDYAGEILDLGRRAWSLLNPSGRRQFEVGVCLEDRDHGDGHMAPCGGIMWAMLLPADPYQPEFGSELQCDHCGHRVPSTDWLKYGRRVKAA